jgi:hypothetical protein
MAAVMARAWAVCITFSAMSAVNARSSDTLFGAAKSQVEPVHAALRKAAAGVAVGRDPVIEPAPR